MTRALTALALLAASGTAAGQTTYTIPSAATPTLQFALESPSTPVQAGDTLELTEAGFYLSTFVINTPDLTIRGAAGQTIVVDGLGLGSVFNVTAAGTGAAFENLTITGGNSLNDGGGINAVGADITIRDCIITGNSSDDDGAGVYVAQSVAVVENTVFTGNTSNLPNSSDNGGGMMGFESDVTIVDSTFDGNTSNNFGGGVYFNNCAVDVRGSTFENNVALHGGGMAFVGGSSGDVLDSLIVNNMAMDDGGGIRSSSSWPDFLRCRVIENTATNDGGGVAISGETTNELDMTSCVIADNTAGDAGGGIVAEVGPDGQMVNCTIVNNAALQGGGVFNQGAGAGLRVRNAILRDNTPSQYPTAGTNVAFNCNISGGELANNTNVIDVDPMFADPQNGNYRLMEGSPSIDAGDAGFLSSQATPTDLDGQPRAVTADASVASGEPILGLFVDHGAFEFQPEPSGGDFCEGDVNRDTVVDGSDFFAWVAIFGNGGCD